MDVVKNPELPELPRFGLRIFLKKEMDQLEYYGIGPQESYIDKCKAGSHGIYTGSVTDQQEDYIKPQENGSHTDCDYVIVKGSGLGIAAYGAKSFAFNISAYTQEELTEKRIIMSLYHAEAPCCVWTINRMELDHRVVVRD